MTGDKDKHISYNALEIENNVTFGNDSPYIIKGKGFVFIKENVKVDNFMFVSGFKCNY